MRVAEGYLVNHRAYTDQYVEFMIASLPVGSGEAESGIRHVIKRRMAVAGAWNERNAALMRPAHRARQRLVGRLLALALAAGRSGMAPAPGRQRQGSLPSQSAETSQASRDRRMMLRFQPAFPRRGAASWDRPWS